MSKTISVDEDFHSWVKAHNREDETMADTLRRLTGGPHPEQVAGILSEETADSILESVEQLNSGDAERLRKAREAADPESV